MTKKVTGGDDFRARTSKIVDRLRTSVEAELFKAAENTRTAVVADIRRLKLPAGVKQPAGGPGRRNHVPSPPGGPPNTDTGRLIDSYTTTAASISRFRIYSAVVAGVRYARYLEFGAPKINLLPRPHLFPRFHEEGERLSVVLRRLFGEAVTTSRTSNRKRT